jgi:hypothetical protein
MEALTRLVSESLARHGFDRPLDYRRLHWSRWFRCESPHSLLQVPSKPGVFAIAEEIMGLDVNTGSPESRADEKPEAASRKPEAVRRLLAVTRFMEDEDMAFVLDRMFTRQNPMQARLSSGRYFVRFVVIEDSFQRRSICNALNQWITNSAEKASGIGAHFASPLELTPTIEHVVVPHDGQTTLFSGAEMGRMVFSAHIAASRSTERSEMENRTSAPASQLDSGEATNHCPYPLPSGF